MSEPQPSSRDAEDEAEIIAALDAVEGRGVRARTSASPDVESRADAKVEAFEAAAGALFAAWPRSSDGPAPSAGFQDRLERFVLSQVTDLPEAAAQDSPPLGGASPPSLQMPTAPSPRGPELHSETPRSADSGHSWGALSAAGWLMAAGLLTYVLLGSPGLDGIKNGSTPATLHEQFEQFVAAGHPVEPWAPTNPEDAVSGGVAWDDELNTGYMEISGLPTNDPKVEQYQLWIFRTGDPTSEPHPVDGGVFDVTSGDQVIVPIDAKLNVGHASIFAITIEEPGGVVVSDRTRLPLLAKRSS